MAGFSTWQENPLRAALFKENTKLFLIFQSFFWDGARWRKPFSKTTNSRAHQVINIMAKKGTRPSADIILTQLWPNILGSASWGPSAIQCMPIASHLSLKVGYNELLIYGLNTRRAWCYQQQRNCCLLSTHNTNHILHLYIFLSFCIPIFFLHVNRYRTYKPRLLAPFAWI